MADTPNPTPKSAVNVEEETTYPSDTIVVMCHIVDASDLADPFLEGHHDGDGGDGGDDHEKHRRRRRREGVDRPSRPGSRAGRIRTGLFLRLMDASACASAEKFAAHGSVTLSFDDVSFDDPTAEVGDVLVVRSTVNCAWGTSMEVGVMCEVEGGRGAGGEGGAEVGDGGEVGDDDEVGRRVCRAFTTFVALDGSGSKIRLPALGAATDEDHRRRRMANERRSIRFRRADIVRRYSEKKSAEDSVDGTGGGGGGGDGGGPNGGTTAFTSVFTELVLPQHAQHHGTTFGGQIMEWMCNAVVVAAARHASRGGRPGLRFAVRSIDDVFFVGPSHVGDRMEIAVRPVYRLGRRELEMSVVVHAHGMDRRDRRLVNRAFVVVAPVGTSHDGDDDEDGATLLLPDVIPKTAEQRAERDAAPGRAALRLERLAIRSAESQAQSIAWRYLDETAPDLCARNVMSLLAMRWSKEGDWKDAMGGGGPPFRLHFKIERGCFIGRAVATLPDDVRADELFDVLLDNDRRPEWDGLLVSAETVAKVDENNDVQRLVVRAFEEGDGDGDEKMELVVLRSWRRDPPPGADKSIAQQGSRRVLVIANHSVLHPLAPLSEKEGKEGDAAAIPRGFSRSSGWIVEVDAAQCPPGASVDNNGGGGGTVTYFVTLGPSLSKLARDVALGRSGEQLMKNIARAVAAVRSRRSARP